MRSTELRLYACSITEVSGFLFLIDTLKRAERKGSLLNVCSYSATSQGADSVADIVVITCEVIRKHARPTHTKKERVSGDDRNSAA